MLVRNNYDECLTNLACSIRKYFNLEYKHNTLDYIDKVLEEYQPKNVVTILCDGMGYNILKRVLKEDDFLIKNCLKPITTVFPATTVAATTSMLTGLNPYETGMLGWTMYYKELNKIVTTFWNYEKEDNEAKVLPEAILYNQKHMIRKTIMEEINEKGIDRGYKLFSFGEDAYEDLDDMFRIIEEKCREDGEKYIYAYDIEPDHTMHDLGCDCEEAKEIILDLNKRIENLCQKVTDTIVFVVADHGHKNVENIYLDDYPDIVDCLLRNTSIEPRAVNFFIKPDKKEIFCKLFNQYFQDEFDLYPRQEIIDSKLFGDGEENPVFRDILGDYLAIAKGNKAILYIGDSSLKSQHAGYTDDEILVPLIMKVMPKED